MDNFSFSINNQWLWPAIIALVIYIALVVLLYRRTSPPFGRAIRISLGIMRYVAVAVIILCLLEPVLSLSFQREDNPEVVMLLDNSQSLRTIENYERKQELLTRLYAGDYDKLIPTKAHFSKYLFSDTLYSDEKLDFEGQQSALGNILQAIQESYKDRNLSSIIVVSDGLSNYGSDPIKIARESTVPIYAIDLGPQKISRDIRIVNVSHDPVGYAGKPLKIEVEIEGRGFEKTSLPVTVKSGGQELARKTVEILGQGQRQKVELKITPTSDGIRDYNISLPVQQSEELAENNRRNINVKVLKSKKRILIASPDLNWEVTFLKRLIASSPDFELDLSILGQSSRLDQVDFPTSQDALDTYDLIILINCRNQFLADHLDRLDKYAEEQGGSIWFMMGNNSTGRIPPSTEGKVLPCRTNRNDRYFNDFDFHAQLTDEGRIHPVTRLIEDSRENLALWQNLPPLEEHLQLISLSPDLQVLAVHPEKTYQDNKIPLIAYRNLGQGKLLYFLTGPFWKMSFLSSGHGEDDFAYKQLINNSINWLTTREDIERIKINTSQRAYRSGQRVVVNAVVLDDNYSPLENSVVDVVVKSENQSDSIIVNLNQDSPGQFKADLGLLPAGDYRLTGTVSWEDKILKKIDNQFKVESFSLEEETLFLPPDLLGKICQASGGKYYTIDNFEDISGEFTLLSKSRTESSETRIAGNIWIMAIILALLTIEWLIRKRLQLL